MHGVVHWTAIMFFCRILQNHQHKHNQHTDIPPLLNSNSTSNSSSGRGKKQKQKPAIVRYKGRIQQWEEKAEGKLSLPSQRHEQRKFIYVKYWKPRGVTCTSDPSDPTNVISAGKFGLFPQRLFSVGRLDKDSTGLLLLTSDGRVNQAMLGANKYDKKDKSDKKDMKNPMAIIKFKIDEVDTCVSANVNVNVNVNNKKGDKEIDGDNKKNKKGGGGGEEGENVGEISDANSATRVRESTNTGGSIGLSPSLSLSALGEKVYSITTAPRACTDEEVQRMREGVVISTDVQVCDSDIKIYT